MGSVDILESFNVRNPFKLHIGLFDYEISARIARIVGFERQKPEYIDVLPRNV